MEDTGNADDLNEESLTLNVPGEETERADESSENPKMTGDEAKQTLSNPDDVKPISSSKHKSDIFFLEVDKQIASPPSESREPQTPRRLNKLRDHASTIFPAGCMGCREDPPSDHHAVSPRRFLDATEAKDYVGHIDNTPRKRPPSAKPCNTRNPLTGAGVNNTDEIKRHSSRRKDGNPLLGEGYDSKNVTPSSTRIPPGGYSQGLW